MTIQQSYLIDEYRAECPAPRRHQAARRYLGMPAKDALEMLIEVLDRYATQLVEDAPYLYPGVVVRIRPMLGGHQPPAAYRTHGAQQRAVVVLVAQDVA